MELFFNTIESIFRFLRSLALALSPFKYYRNDPLDYKALPFASVLHAVQPTLNKPTGLHWILTCIYQGEPRETHIFLTEKFDPGKPTIVFHHPSGETNHKLAASFILGSIIAKQCNIFLIKAQKHDSTTQFLHECVDSFLHHQLTFAGSTLAVEAIVRYHKKHAKTTIVVSGASMGGIVATLHAYFFGSADRYVPLAAYPNVGEIFMGAAYKFGIDNWEKRRANTSTLSSFRLTEPFARAVASRIIPVLGTKDRIVSFSKARAFWQSMHIPFRSYPFGHFTPAIMRKDVRRLITGVST